jgi:hypothetical protein
VQAKQLTTKASGAEAERDRGDGEAVHHGRHRPAEEERKPAGRRREQDREGLEAALSPDRMSHPEQARDGCGDEAVPDQEEGRIDTGRAAEVGEEEDLEQRIGNQHRDEHPRVDPREQSAIAGHPAREEDA